MKRYIEILKKCALFDGVSEADMETLLACLNVSVATYQKGEAIFSEGDRIRSFGIVLSGAVGLVQNDYRGNRSILESVCAANIFGACFAFAEDEPLSVDVEAFEPAEVMFVDARRITRSCKNACSFHGQVIVNLLKLIAEKNLVFHRKLLITAQRTTREKLMAYLFSEAKKYGSQTFEIPYDRQELADYLEVERSGLSAEIGKLRREGVLEAEKNRFTILKMG